MAEARQYYTWCPHGTYDPRGCGVCISHREANALIEHVRAAERDAVKRSNRMAEELSEAKSRRRDDAIYCASEAFSEGIKAAVRKKTSFDASGFVDRWLAELDAEREKPPSEAEQEAIERMQEHVAKSDSGLKMESPLGRCSRKVRNKLKQAGWSPIGIDLFISTLREEWANESDTFLLKPDPRLASIKAAWDAIAKEVDQATEYWNGGILFQEDSDFPARWDAFIEAIGAEYRPAAFELDSGEPMGEPEGEVPADITSGAEVTDESLKDEIIESLNRPFVVRMERVLQVFLDRINQQAEANMLKSGKLEGSHYAAMQSIDRPALVREVLKEFDDEELPF